MGDFACLRWEAFSLQTTRLLHAKRLEIRLSLGVAVAGSHRQPLSREVSKTEKFPKKPCEISIKIEDAPHDVSTILFTR
jgi:hypothetical protein